MSINFTPVPAGVGNAAGMGGVEAPRGNLGQRLFTACKGRAMRAARALSRMVDRIVHFRSGPATLRRAQAGGPPRAGLPFKDPAAARAARRSSPPTLTAPSSPRLAVPPSPSMASARSVPSGMMYGVARDAPYGTPHGTSHATSYAPYGRSGASSHTNLASIPLEGVRLKPGRSGSRTPTPTPSSGPDSPPPLPPRSPRQRDIYGGAPLPGAGVPPAPTLVFRRPQPAGSCIAAPPAEAPPAPPPAEAPPAPPASPASQTS